MSDLYACSIAGLSRCGDRALERAREVGPFAKKSLGKFASHAVLAGGVLAVMSLGVGSATAGEASADFGVDATAAVLVAGSDGMGADEIGIDQIGGGELGNGALETVRGTGLGDTPLGLGGDQLVGVILWDEVKRNKLGQQQSGNAGVTVIVHGVVTDVTGRVTAY